MNLDASNKLLFKSPKKKYFCNVTNNNVFSSTPIFTWGKKKKKKKYISDLQYDNIKANSANTYQHQSGFKYCKQ